MKTLVNLPTGRISAAYDCPNCNCNYINSKYVGHANRICTFILIFQELTKLIWGQTNQLFFILHENVCSFFVIQINMAFARQTETGIQCFTHMLKHKAARKVIIAHRKKPIKGSTSLQTAHNKSRGQDYK